MVLCKDTETGHVGHIGLYSTSREEIERFMEKIGEYELNAMQKEQLRLLKAYSKTYESVRFCVRKAGLSEEQIKEEDKQQKEIKKEIKDSVIYHYIKEDF